jgi:adenylylsulfate kinase-like enzyme
VYALVITGPPGSGKSATLEALCDLLHDGGVAHACLDVDALTWAHPALPPEACMRHVAALAGLYRDAGYDLLLVAGAMPSQTEREALMQALGASEEFVVRLHAPDETLRDRITAREPTGWPQLGRLLERAGEMRTRMAPMDADLVLDTAYVEPARAAQQICTACPRIRRAMRP